ncbi:hypothetical protein lerEdw1_004985 [Lerista edwardsae]|nr:hypothetical protein lerEdw1_004985 [Lerista edwardsae]
MTREGLQGAACSLEAVNRGLVFSAQGVLVEPLSGCRSPLASVTLVRQPKPGRGGALPPSPICHPLPTEGGALDSNENPGPGFYNVTHPSALLSNVSQSRKGTCFFPSLELRIARQRIPSYPAANAYNLPPTLQSKHDFSLGCSSMFQLPIARKISKRATPAPNQYNVSVDSCKQNCGSGAKSVFCSRTRRAMSFGAKERGPSPCHYRVNDSFVRESPTVLVSCFKSRTSRETKTETLSPGPAAYQHPDSPVAPPRKFRGP